MKLNILVIALLGAALFWLAAPQRSASQTERVAYEVHATAYTCEAHPRNPMHPCGPLRWGGNVYSAGMACPVTWRNKVLEVPGYGVLRCDDTPRDGWIGGRAHIDIRVSTYAEARRFGVRRMVIYAMNEVAAPTPAPVTGLATSEAALARAAQAAPTGDINTAMPRLLWGETARKHFPELFDGTAIAADQPIWMVSVWVPPTTIPAGTVAKPDGSKEIAAELLLFNARTGELLLDTFISADVVEKIGWVASDSINISP
ncbi:MAG: hypothetical protein H0T73_12145 [Ardenticatenales bacterium]|nr:hypothetical protein [Ardenticatenales bacterium]